MLCAFHNNIWVPRVASYKKQEVPTLREHHSSPLISFWAPCYSSFYILLLTYCVSLLLLHTMQPQLVVHQLLYFLFLWKLNGKKRPHSLHWNKYIKPIPHVWQRHAALLSCSFQQVYKKQNQHHGHFIFIPAWKQKISGEIIKCGFME